ncbi:MAG: hypothetical protein ACPGJV_05970 [Bacteriovoracaceae bacterium]
MNSWFRLVLVLYKKELNSFIRRPLLYVVLSLFLFLTGWIFFNYLAALKEMTNLTLELQVLKPLFGNVNFIFLFLVPLLTMKSFSEESREGTLSLLRMSKLSHLQIVVSKFLALQTILFAFILILGLYPLVLYFSGYENFEIIASALFGLCLSSATYIMVGLFCSSLTKNQVFSALLSYTILFSTMLLVLSANATSNYLVAQILQYASFLYHFEMMAQGLVRNYSLIYFLSFTGLFGILSKYSLDARRW